MHRGGTVAQSVVESAGGAGIRNSADCAHPFASAEHLLAELDSLDVLLKVEGDQLALFPPEAGISDDLLARVRAQKTGLLHLLRSEAPFPDVAASVPAEDGNKANESPPDHDMLLCPWCGPERLSDASDGLQCTRCSRLAWVEGEDGSLTRADMLDTDWEGVSPDEIALCESCGDLCDTVTGMDEWACSRCDPLADVRRETTVRMLELKQKLLAEHRLHSKVTREK